MSFLPVNPRNFSFKFVRTRENTPADSGFWSTRYTSVGYMEGSITLPRYSSNSERADGKDDIKQLMVALAEADRPEGFFFADLVLPHQKEFGTPVWHPATGASSVTKLWVDQELDLDAGAIVSIRNLASGVRDFVTARIATGVRQASGETSIALNHPLPFEFLPDDVARLEVCFNRPHVRAIFSDEAPQWSINYHQMASITRLNWKEDTAGIIRALRGQSDSTPVTPPPAPGDGYITLENGSAIELEDGSGNITLEPS